MKKVIAVLFVSVILSGCSVYMAAKQPDKKNFDLLKAGVERRALLAELGKPESTEVVDGNRVDFFRFVQGYTQGAKTGRAIFHGFADLMTIGIWEVIGTPTESALDGTETVCEVTYDNQDKAEKIVLIQGDNDPIVVSSDEYEEEWFRRQEMKVSGILAGRIDSFDAKRDIKDLAEEKDVPEGYSVVVGASFVSSPRPMAALPSLEAQEGMSRYTSATVFRHMLTGKRFVMSGPRTHVYMVPAGEYEIVSVSAGLYSDAELRNAQIEKSDTGEKTKGAASLLFAFQDIAGSALDTVYSPVSSVAGEKSRMAWKTWKNGTSSRLSVREGDVVYLGHIQTHSVKNNKLLVDCLVYDEGDKVSSDLLGKYPFYASRMSKNIVEVPSRH